ncbi:VOC family protein [Mucilaginibacter sp. ZT4R22]|uniref:VOC family protein n=1 Tax=Mucilaginibacter pankratovii TaxID=2772110 RepID=A0ABR7WND9_9SPHI|nr:VOC family protein [Mucilaginibacter pankratovii]MBD1363681.1 VOC family protein [Mucilaginibacter pankratovii]
MATFNPYLNFLGNTEEAFNFYKSVFGGEFTFLQRFKDTPHGGQMSPEDQEKIMHVALPLGRNTTLMGTDALEAFGHTLTFGNNFSIAFTPDNLEDAHRFFNGISEGGVVQMPLEKMFWGAWFGQCTDKFGLQWMVNLEIKE